MALLEDRGRTEGYIHGLVDAGHLTTRNTDRDYLILSIVQRRREFLEKLLNEGGWLSNPAKGTLNQAALLR
jgi:hypothetical protein